MRNDIKSALCIPPMPANGTRVLMRLGLPTALAFGVGLMLVGFGGLGFAARRRRASKLRRAATG